MNQPQPIRILVNAPLGVGGVSNMMINIQSNLDRTKINFDYLVFHDRKEPQEDTVLAMGSRKLVASVDHVRFRPLRRILRINEIRKVCKKNNIKILHYNADCAADITNIIGAKLGGVKHITIHSHNAGVGSLRWTMRILSWALKPLIPCLCDCNWGCSNRALQYLLPKSILAKGEYIVIPNGINLDKYEYDPQMRRQMRERLHIEDKFVLGHAGRFAKEKNHDYLLDIFAKVHERDDSAVLLLFGVGDFMEPMKEKARRLGLSDCVIFYGASDEMEKMWQVMDVFVMPSLFEGLPVTGIEAQAAGLPCVFADTITREVDVSNSSTFLSLQDPPEVWSDAILACRGLVRRSRCEELRAAGFDEKEVAKYFQKYYLELDIE